VVWSAAVRADLADDGVNIANPDRSISACTKLIEHGNFGGETVACW
jgi:hypothetical protein